MAGEGEGETSYRGGAGGKFPKRFIRRNQKTPYDRPPSIVRNPRPGGWVSKLFDPASKFISARAFKFFSNFRKRLTEAEQETKDGPQDAAPSLVDCNGAGSQDIVSIGNITNSSEGSQISDLEQMLQQKTFTRSEIDRLTELLHSRTTDSSFRDEEKTNEGNLYKPVSDIETHNVFTRSPLQENRDDSNKSRRNVPAIGASSRALEDDISSPAELAKAYMGSRPSKVSPSMLGVRSRTFKDERPLFNHGVFPSKSSSLSLGSKSVLSDGVSVNCFTTPRSRGRSAIYNMARTPYSRGIGSTKYIYGGPSSSPQSAWEHSGQIGSKELALKRRSSLLDDSGSVGAMRRIRQKPNLSYQASPVSERGTDFGYSGGGQYPISSTDKPLLLSNAKKKVSKNGEECEDDSIDGSRYPLVHSQSHQMASKILQHLEKFSPQEKSSESKLITARDKSPIKLTSNMLHGQALRSLENVDLTKFLQKQDGERLEVSSNALPDAGGETFGKKSIVEKNGFKEPIIPLKLTASSAGANATISMTNAVPNMNGDSFVSKFAAQPSRKKRTFHKSANEDFSELDDETHTNGFISVSSGKMREELQIFRHSVSPQAVEKNSAKSEGKIPENLASTSTNDLKISGGLVAAKENIGIQTPAVPSRDLSGSPTLSGLSSKNVDTLPSSTISLSPCGESTGPNPTSWYDSRRQSLNSFGNDAHQKTRESDKVDVKNADKVEHVSRFLDNSTSAAVSANTASGFVSSTVSAEKSILNNGLVDSSHSSHLIAPKLPSSNSTEQVFGCSSTIVHSPTIAAMTSGSTSSPSVFAVAPHSFSTSPTTSPPSFPSEPVAAHIFSSGSSKMELSPAATFSTATGAETTEIKSNGNETLFSNSNKPPSSGSLFATTNAGNNSFGFSSLLASSSSNNQSPASFSGFGSSSAVSSQLPPTTGASTVTQSAPFQFGSSGSSTIFRTSGTSFTTVTGSSLPTANPFGSGTSTISTTTSPFSNTPNSSCGATTSIFSSSSQISKSPVMDSAAISPSPSTLFSFGASHTASATSSIPPVFGQSTGTSSGSTFSFTSPTATTSSPPSLSQSKPVFGSTTSLRGPENSGDQINMEDSMAEDPVHSLNPSVPVFGHPLGSSSNPTVPAFGQPLVSASNPTVPAFGQPLFPPSPPGFMFGSTALSPSLSPSPFQFGVQQNQAAPQNLPIFQASNSLDFNGGGSFSLGSGGGDKGSRKIIRVSRNKNRKK